VIALITEWQEPDGARQRRGPDSDLGGTMRLGAQPCLLQAGSLVRRVYGKELISERHRHRYEFNNLYRPAIEAAGLRFCGMSQDKNLVEVIEVPAHPWFVGCQFHPEFTSTPRDGHPLFTGFIDAAIKCRDAREQLAPAS
jgi:CTP synthase